ncbi:MAG: phosphohydrolase [Chlamydiae bacterium CG10_big_fil_rev_8_21_14_0_10_42_34]|nr:MAG: phosphohydrolase [Chlamydiae bacterium CG10_big_fil_rev_8_21_14_0_10_42_34]
MVKDFLYADKKIYDSVHGFIPFDEFEKELIDSLPFQRLHYIHQLGIAYLVYPGATHTRFEHSLGVMSLATLMFEKICKSVRPDVFHFVPRKGSTDFLYWRRVIRMAALCHDLGHLPFSHVAEKELLGAMGHEYWTLKVIDSPYLTPVWEKLKNAPAYLEDLTGRNILEDIKKISVGENKWSEVTGQTFSPWERIVSEVITGDFFGADRIDYLLRDAKSTGVAYGLFDYHQLIESLRILPSADHGSDELQLGIDENGLESSEALLLARHFMHRRIYQYSSVKAYNFHLRRYMLANYSKKLDNVEEFLALSDTDVTSALNKAAKDPKLAGHADAKCVIFRQHRFRAIALSDNVSKEDLENFKTRHKLTDADIDWEFHKADLPPDRLSFPVSRRHLVIQKAKDCSDLLLKVPSKKENWVYISPEHDLELVNFLEHK